MDAMCSAKTPADDDILLFDATMKWFAASFNCGLYSNTSVAKTDWCCTRVSQKYTYLEQWVRMVVNSS